MGAAAAMSLACLVVWAVSQVFTHIRGHDVPVLPALPAIATAGLIVFAAHALALGPWVALGAGMAVFLAVAFAFDHHLIDELSHLARGEPPSALTTPTSQPAPEGARI
jgi:hypothetical protein